MLESPEETDPAMMRRGSKAGEPLIVVEESGGIREESGEEEEEEGSQTGPDSPSLNPYLLSPYRDLRKRSLPTPPCTSGITASQVRRLSEQGGEGGKGPSAMEAAFLATLSQAPAPTGRRHSVVTISRVPPTSLFGRNRRESIAAFSRFPRKDSTPSLSGSNFNLQLDIMDDIAEIKKARKVKLKMWQTENEEKDHQRKDCSVETDQFDYDDEKDATPALVPKSESGYNSKRSLGQLLLSRLCGKVCEVSEGGSVARYHQKETRRFSDVTGIPPLREQARRRASQAAPSQPPAAGIVCSNTDLNEILTSLTSSAAELPSPPPPVPQVEEVEKPPVLAKPTPLEEKRNQLKNNRSNSFDVSLLPKGEGKGNWFLRRHVPMEGKGLDRKSGSLKEKLVWDKPSGSVVDPQVLGSAIEVFLNKRASDQPEKKWSEPKEQEEEVSCDNSICSTLKDLFIK